MGPTVVGPHDGVLGVCKFWWGKSKIWYILKSKFFLSQKPAFVVFTGEVRRKTPDPKRGVFLLHGGETKGIRNVVRRVEDGVGGGTGLQTFRTR